MVSVQFIYQKGAYFVHYNPNLGEVSHYKSASYTEVLRNVVRDLKAYPKEEISPVFNSEFPQELRSLTELVLELCEEVRKRRRHLELIR